MADFEEFAVVRLYLQISRSKELPEGEMSSQGRVLPDGEKSSNTVVLPEPLTSSNGSRLPEGPISSNRNALPEGEMSSKAVMFPDPVRFAKGVYMVLSGVNIVRENLFMSGAVMTGREKTPLPKTSALNTAVVEFRFKGTASLASAAGRGEPRQDFREGYAPVGVLPGAAMAAVIMRAVPSSMPMAVNGMCGIRGELAIILSFYIFLIIGKINCPLCYNNTNKGRNSPGSLFKIHIFDFIHPGMRDLFLL